MRKFTEEFHFNSSSLNQHALQILIQLQVLISGINFIQIKLLNSQNLKF